MTIPAGSTVALGYSSANHDETVFECPEKFDLDRGDVVKRQLGFGWGVHLCVGAPLARLEGAHVLNAVLDRIPSMRLAPGFEYQRVKMFMMRGPVALDVEFDPASLRETMEEIRETPDGPALKFVHVDEVEAQEVVAQMHGDRRVGVHLKFLEWTKDRMVAFTYYDPGLILERHAHESDALVFVIEGDVDSRRAPVPARHAHRAGEGRRVRPPDRGARRLHVPRVLRRRRAACARRQGRLLQAPRGARDRATPQPRVGGTARGTGPGTRRRGQLVLSGAARSNTADRGTA